MLFGQTMHNRASRFIDEIPKENLEGSLYKYRAAFEFDADGAFADSKSEMKKPVHIPSRPAADYEKSILRPTVKEDAVRIKKGDLVDHKAFGRGLVVGVSPMGGDALLEIAFDKVGTKRLMAKSASQYLKKAETV
jgi:DNA helicase-2/ATP-dependent DNA helicase PcrA